MRWCVSGCSCCFGCECSCFSDLVRCDIMGRLLTDLLESPTSSRPRWRLVSSASFPGPSSRRSADPLSRLSRINQVLTTTQGISVGSKLFPPRIHSTALALVFVIGQIGGSAFPIVTGVLATRVGVSVLQPILVGLYVATAVSWLLIPKPKTANAALHEE